MAWACCAVAALSAATGCASDVHPAARAQEPRPAVGEPSERAVVERPRVEDRARASRPVAREPDEPPPRIYGRADTDPDNDDVVAPPDAVPECEAALAAAGVRHQSANLPLRQKRREVFTCGAYDAVVYLEGPSGLRFRPRPVVTCQMALALSRFEGVVQEVAKRELGARVVEIRQLGTYACRKMAAYPTMVSEHSYANAIDIGAFVLDDGRRITVARHFGSVTEEARESRGRFLRGLARRLYDEDVFSVVLTPYFDAHHRDHFHVDLARYRVDGARVL